MNIIREWFCSCESSNVEDGYETYLNKQSSNHEDDSLTVAQIISKRKVYKIKDPSATAQPNYRIPDSPIHKLTDLL